MNYSRPTISSQNILLIIGAIVIVGSAVYISRNGTSTTDNGLTYQAPLIATSTLINIETTSTKDWEKELISTHTYDPKHPTIDFYTGTSTNGKDKPLTSTQTLARTLFAKYMSLNQIGLGDDKASQDEGVNEVLAASLKNFNPPIYEESQVKTSPDTSVEAIRNYGNAVGNAFITNNVQARNETVIVKESLEKNDEKILSELDPTIASYGRMLKELLAIKPPVTLRTQHTAMINSVAEMLYLDQNFKKTFSDPVVSLQAIAYYEKTTQDLTAAFLGIRTSLIAAGIKYAETEGGTLFIKP